MLAALSLLGVTIMMGNSMQFRMATNASDRDIAFQAAESALRDGETDVLRNLSAGNAYDTNCTDGLCLSAVSGSPIWKTIDWNNDAVTRRYGSRTNSPALHGVAAPPRYIVERLVTLPPSAGESIAIGFRPASGGIAYRVTALGYGGRSDTRVMLQAIVMKRE